MSEEEKKELEVAESDNADVEEQVAEQPVEEAPEEQPAEPVQEEAPVEEPEKPKKAKKERKKPTKEQKKKRTIKALIIVGSILLAFAIFISGCAIANATGTKALLKQGSSVEKVVYTEHVQLHPVKDADGYWTFTQPAGDREFKVVQFTDVHIGGGCFSSQKDAWAMNAVATMIRQEQPDLVIVTGDIAYPVPFQAGTFNNLHATQIFSNMMESLGVYWTFAFGNHDTEIYGTHDKQDI
ncbi:MAG: metallophosphoesterase, partial [Clostridia bacterium]|nr:metallophosphoesterase [Clostridia bacterium]